MAATDITGNWLMVSNGFLGVRACVGRTPVNALLIQVELQVSSKV
jgi:hypothetical protein